MNSKNFHTPCIMPLPTAVKDHLSKYDGLVSLTLKHFKMQRVSDDIRDVNMQHNFHPLDEPDLYWVDLSITKALDIIIYSILTNNAVRLIC